jgi:hypothetical protein
VTLIPTIHLQVTPIPITSNSPARLATRRRERSHSDAPSDLIIEDRRSRRATSATSSPSTPVTRKQNLRTRDFNINNMVIPYNVSTPGTTVHRVLYSQFFRRS